ncbi:hypothetical protein INR77_04500 [Erythrobacter sp. SCSIO 43205]|uniref:hypothetical protein n=1 Tax=Erythrobacter sp. SCSIO 43205 TaxID=2779361 RepID=UPI001CA9610E|nr:hypothetical protein [Erythrobacter sp. SCSIO 43205]UAB78964.1 hypothetical protein INR77_04500 [Erythrobacter sp. SCSIO 43205]
MRFIVHKVSVDPVSGKDVLVPLNEGGTPFDLEQLKSALGRLYLENWKTASPDEGVIISPVDSADAQDGKETSVALSYSEIAEKFQFLEEHGLRKMI